MEDTWFLQERLCPRLSVARLYKGVSTAPGGVVAACALPHSLGREEFIPSLRPVVSAEFFRAIYVVKDVLP